MRCKEEKPRAKRGKLKITQEGMVSIIRYAIKTDGLEAARDFFEQMNKYCSTEQGWPETAREIRDIFADEREQNQKVLEERRIPHISISNINGDNNTSTNMEGNNARYWEIHKS